MSAAPGGETEQQDGSEIRHRRTGELDTTVSRLTAENERLRDALRKVEYLGSQAQSNAAIHMGMIARSALRTLAEKHQAHYRSCGCLGDSAICCDPACECHDEAAQSGSTNAPRDAS